MRWSNDEETRYITEKDFSLIGADVAGNGGVTGMVITAATC